MVLIRHKILIYMLYRGWRELKIVIEVGVNLDLDLNLDRIYIYNEEHLEKVNYNHHQIMILIMNHFIKIVHIINKEAIIQNIKIKIIKMIM